MTWELYTKCYLKLLILIFQVAKKNSFNVTDKNYLRLHSVILVARKNLLDNELMQSLLDKEGYQFDWNINDANVVIVNSYSFIETGREESIRKLLECTNKGKEVIFAGCMYGSEFWRWTSKRNLK